MKRTWALTLAALLALGLMGGCGPVEAEPETPPEEKMETDGLPPSAGVKTVPYTSLSYLGLDTNPQNITKLYDVGSDGDFVAAVWEALNYDDWTERQEGSAALVSIDLDFSGTGSSLQLAIDPNDVGWTKESENNYSESYVYFDIPDGTYERVKTLLKEYTNEHFMPEISPELIDIDTESDWPISFASGEIYFVLSPEQAGEFTEDWQTDAWKELEAENIVFSDKILVFNGIYSKDGRGPVDMRIDMELLLASITYEGQTNTYEITPEACQLISQRFESLQLLGQRG